MSGPVTLHDVERELGRVVDRLMAMPLSRADAAAPAVREAAAALLAHCRELDPDIPSDAVLPDLGPAGRGPLIAVLGGEWLAAARVAEAPAASDVLDVLVSLRRALP